MDDSSDDTHGLTDRRRPFAELRRGRMLSCQRKVSFHAHDFEFSSERIEFIPESRFNGRRAQFSEIELEKQSLDRGGFGSVIRHGATLPPTDPRPGHRGLVFVRSRRRRKDGEKHGEKDAGRQGRPIMSPTEPGWPNASVR